MSIVLNGKTYSFAGNAAGVTSYMETSAGVRSGFSSLTAEARLAPVQSSPSKGTPPRDHVKWKLNVPFVADEASACACPGNVLDTEALVIDMSGSAGLTLAQRTDVLARLRALVLTTEFGNSFLYYTVPMS